MSGQIITSHVLNRFPIPQLLANGGHLAGDTERYNLLPRLGDVTELGWGTSKDILNKTRESPFCSDLQDRETSAQAHARLCRRLGTQLSLKGPSVFNPFGGCDVHTPFMLVAV